VRSDSTSHRNVVFTPHLWVCPQFDRTRTRRRNFADSAQHALRLVLWVAFLQACGCDRDVVEQKPARVVVTGSGYVPLTHEMMIGARWHSRTGNDRTCDDLQWRFENETFHIRAGRHGLPPDLCEALLSDNVITCTEIEVDGNPLPQETRYLRTMSTPPLRILTGPQYEFVHSQPQSPQSK